MSDDFCVIHGYDHMKFRPGHPIPFCEACEQEDEFMRELKESERTDRPIKQEGAS